MKMLIGLIFKSINVIISTYLYICVLFCVLRFDKSYDSK